MEILTDDLRAMRERFTRRAFLGRVGHGPGRAGPGRASLDPRRLLRRGPADARGAASSSRCTSRRGPSASSTSTRPAARRTSRLFDYKPKLAEMDGQPMPESFTKGQPIAQLQGQQLRCFGPQHPFQRCGQVGPGDLDAASRTSASIADEICIIRSMQTEQINHDPAHTFMNTGTQISGRPSAGSWIWYGLGAEAEDLPGFVVLTSHGPRRPDAADRRRGSGTAASCPAASRACSSARKGDAVLYLRDPEGVDRTRSSAT